MKTAIILYITALIFCFSNLFGQEQKISLKLEEGHEYIFEKIDKGYFVKTDDSNEVYSTHKKVIRLVVEKDIEGEKIQFSVEHLENFEDRSTSENYINVIDYFFPDFQDGSYSGDSFESFSCRFKPRFSINLKNGEIELLNRVELLEAFHSRLNEQGRNNESIKSLIENANKRSLGQVKDLVGFLNWFHNSTLTQEETIEDSRFEGKFIVSEREGKFLNFGDQLMEDFVPGKTYKKYWINLENGLITNYSTIQYDSLESNSFSYRYRNYKWRANETNFRLLYSQKIPPNKLFVSGKIEEPLSKKVHIKILDSPFGTELKTKTVLLDSKGAFKTNLDYSHGGFVYVENENKNKHKPPGTYVFYAEPGDSILFESTGKSLPWNTEVAGTRVNEAKLIQKLRKEIDLFKDQRRLSGTSNLILDKDYFTGVSFTDGKVKIDADIDFLFQAFEKAKSIISGYKNKISEKAFGFIKNEITNYFYHGAFNVGSTLINSELFYDEMNADKEVLSRIDDLNIHFTS